MMNQDTIPELYYDYWYDALTRRQLADGQNGALDVDDNNDDDDEESSARAIVATVASNFFLFFLIFGLSATVEIKNLRRQLQNRFAIACGVLMQFVIMPLLGFLAVVTLREAGMTHPMAIALLVVTTSPGGSYSNWWCSLFNADLALSVAMTTCSSILSVAFLPLNLLLYSYLAFGIADQGGESVIEALDFGALFISLAIVLTAIISGLTMGYHFDYPAFHIMANRFGSISGILLIVFSVFLSSGGDGAESKLWNMDWSFYVGVAMPCLLGLTIATMISKGIHLSKPETVTIAIECCYQNTGIATSVAITMFSDPEERAQAVAVPLFYGIIEAVFIGIYCIWAWKAGWTKAPPDDNFCVMLANTYEVGRDDPVANAELPTQGDVIHPGGGNNDTEIIHGNVPNILSSSSSNSFRHKGINSDSSSVFQEQSYWSRLWHRIMGSRHTRSDTTDFSTSVEGSTPVKTKGSLQSTLSTVSSSAMRPSNIDTEMARGVEEGNDDANRNRFVSADYTAATTIDSASSPRSPFTPTTNTRTMNFGSNNDDDVDDVAEAIHDRMEDNDDIPVMPACEVTMPPKL